WRVGCARRWGVAFVENLPEWVRGRQQQDVAWLARASDEWYAAWHAITVLGAVLARACERRRDGRGRTSDRCGGLGRSIDRCLRNARCRRGTVLGGAGHVACSVADGHCWQRRVCSGARGRNSEPCGNLSVARAAGSGA